MVVPQPGQREVERQSVPYFEGSLLHGRDERVRWCNPVWYLSNFEACKAMAKGQWVAPVREEPHTGLSRM